MAKKLIAVIGLGQFGKAIVEELVENGCDVLAIDVDGERVASIKNILPTVAIADSTNELALDELGFKDVDIAIVAIGAALDATIITTALLKDLGIPRILVRVENDHYIPILKKIGATEIITPQKIAGIGLANRINDDDFRDFYSLDSKYSVVSIEVNPNFEPVTLIDANPKGNYNVMLVLIKRNNESFVPGGSDSILPGDWVYVVGTKKDVSTFSHYIGVENKAKKIRKRK